MRVKDVLEVTIIDDNHLGNGIAKYKDFIIFVPKTLKDDIVNIEIKSINKKIATATVINYIKRSTNNMNVKCHYYSRCGGCNLLHVSYERENELKKNYIKRLFGLECDIFSFDREHYRNKVTLHVNNNTLGLYEEKSNTLVEISNCLLLDEAINHLVLKLKCCDLSKVKDIIIKKSEEGLLISINGDISNDLDFLKDSVVSIYQNNKLIYGKEYVTINLGDIIYNINHNSFFQINTECAKTLYDKIKEEVGICNSLLDLYCGTASIGIYLSKNVKSITGIEINKESVSCAKKNIEDNSVSNYKIIHGDASVVKGDYDVVVVDPPRSGLSRSVIDILNNMKMKKLIYVSCNPSTLKRDITLLKGFSIKNVFAFNMFPGTSHIETMMVLEK